MVIIEEREVESLPQVSKYVFDYYYSPLLSVVLILVNTTIHGSSHFDK